MPMPTVKRILLATDLADGSQSAVEFISTLAAQLGSELHLLHVAAGPSRAAGGDPIELPNELQSQFDRLSLTASFNRVHTVSAIRTGRPAEAIVSYARTMEIGLIAMGTRGRGHLTQSLLGSAAEQVIRTAPCPVLVLPPSCFKWNGGRMVKAVKRLAAEYGPGVVGPRDETRAKILSLLKSDSELGEAEVALLLESLESIGAVTWHEGETDGAPNSRYWAINPDVVRADATVIASGSLDAPETSAAGDLLRHAISNHATDIHIDPASEDEVEVRLRIDGRLEHYCRLDRHIAAPMTQQYKVLARLDIADPFKPQEGRLSLPDEFAGCEARITTAPVHYGQAIALRLFNADRLFQPLNTLGFSNKSLETVEQILQMRSGLVLVTGPTGSGKTTTIYSLLHRLSATAPNIISIEDPVEYRLPFMRQIGVNPRHGVNMTSGLRTILRMDPDIVFLGEIRDGEAAEIAMRAASAGRFVFSTLHTRDVASTVTALRDLKVDSRSLGANLTGIISQRLVRRLCRKCCRPEPISSVEMEIFTQAEMTPPAELMHAVGCENCRKTGYRDRIGIFEAMTTAGAATEAIVKGASEAEFSRVLRDTGACTLFDDGLGKVSEGLTTFDEILGMRSIPSHKRLE